jgi:topoisomerase (DNA) II binding protein 1
MPILQTTKTPVELSKHTTQQLLSRATSTSTIFRGHLFALVRIAPPSWAADFDSKQQETLIKSHGGQMVSLKLLDAMRMDAVKSDDTGGGKRKCFVVCWGGFSQTHMELNPILSQLKRYNLCDMELVNPIWLQTCISVQKRVHSHRIKCAFEPQTWPFRRLELPDNKMKPIRISLTGYQGTEKAAIIHLTKAFGATFLDSMSNAATTHLICKRSGGAKYEMAIKWGIHAVSVDWLYHVLRYGYGGKEESKIGCELAFCFEESVNHNL